MSETIEERWPKRWHCVEARDNEFAEQSGPGKPIFAVRNGVNIGTVDLCPKCFETFDHHAAKPEQPPFTQCQRVRTKDGRVLDVSRCEKRVVHGALRWVVDDLNGMRAFASDCELIKNMELVNAETGQAVIHLDPQHPIAPPGAETVPQMDIDPIVTAFYAWWDDFTSTAVTLDHDKWHDSALLSFEAGYKARHAPKEVPQQGVEESPQADFHAFARAQSEWSQATFGSDLLRGPAGPLKHLEKESREAQENPTDIFEFVDCLFLTLDAARRAGFSSEALLRAAWEKLAINKAREWPKVTDMNAAVEHVKDAAPQAGEVREESADAQLSGIIKDAAERTNVILDNHRAALSLAPAPRYAPRYACSKLAAVGDTVQIAGPNLRQTLNYGTLTVENVEEQYWVSARDSHGTLRRIAAGQLEFVPDVTPAHPVCRGCNQPLKDENAWMSDGCPCNSPRGINHGLVPKKTCTCEECDPAEPNTTCDFDFDEAANKAAAFLKGSIDSDSITVCAEWISDIISAQIRPGVQALYAKLQHRRCDTCGANTIDGCTRCGAPQCCPQCCKIDDLTRQLGTMAVGHLDTADQCRERLAVAMSLLGQSGARSFLLGAYEARLKDGKWSLQKNVMGSWVYQGEFADPVQAALRAKELADVGKAS